jgi:hypothetical protein
MKTVFLRVLEADDKAEALLSAIHEPERGRQRFVVDTASFTCVPRSPFAYWVSDRLRALFGELEPFEAEGRTARHGAATLDDIRFARSWLEVTPGDPTWVGLAKGGSYAPYYADVLLVLKWLDHGAELKAYASAVRARNGWGEHWSAVLNGYSFYFRPGITWPHRSARFSAAALPSNCVFSQSGKAAFAPTGNLPTLLGLMNGSVITLLCRVQSDAVRIKFEVGLVERLPFPSISTTDAVDLATLASRAWLLKRSLDTRIETSHAFILPALLQVEGETLVGRAAAWGERIQHAEVELAAIQSEIDERCFDLYGIDAADRRAITEGFGVTAISATEDTEAEADEDAETEAAEEAAADAATLTAELLSWAVGVAFGRYDIGLATGERVVPPDSEPFDALPVCSPGMLTGEDGLPLNAPPTGYPIDFPSDGVLVDDAGHPYDLTAAVRAVFEVVYGASADARWNEAAALLDPKERNLRAWLAQTFFDQHLKRHSKSRRKAPIVWQIGTPSAEYSVWLYAHRLTKDSLFQIQNDLVGPKLALELRKQLGLAQAAGPNPSSSQRREIAAQEAFVEALRGMLDEVKRVAPLWAPDLNDGIVLTMAPLWRLVPQHKGWQKELKTTWDALCAGRYDWAHLAMHLWPERVVPKCATDRSLAIAHDLEDVFWVAGADGKWKPRVTPTKTIEALVAERASPAVKAALKSLLEAPSASTGGSGRPRKARGVA